VEKIKTIGDAYMAAAGLPDPRPDHAAAALALARDMLRTARVLEARTGNPSNCASASTPAPWWPA
jgi:class 3 adenylate cyclase